MSSFALWSACQRLFNVAPVFVEDSRGLTGGGEVRFIASLHSPAVTEIESLYKEDSILAFGEEDEESGDRWVAVEDYFNGEPCILVIRFGTSYLESDAATIEVQVLVEVTDETRALAISRVRDASHEDFFEEHSARDDDTPVAEEEPVPEYNAQGKSLLDRWLKR